MTKKQRNKVYRDALKGLNSATYYHPDGSFCTEGLCDSMKPDVDYIDLIELDEFFSRRNWLSPLLAFPMWEEWGHTIRAMILLDAINKTK